MEPIFESLSGEGIMCAKHTTTSKKLKAKKYPQKRKLLSKDTIKRLNKIFYCQNILHRSRNCNNYIPLGSPERQKHHIIPLSKGGTNNGQNILICCIDCHYSLHQEELESRGISLEQFRNNIYLKFGKLTRNSWRLLDQCRKAEVGVLSY